MLAIVSVVLPVFGLIGLGYLARATNYVGDRTGDGQHVIEAHRNVGDGHRPGRGSEALGLDDARTLVAFDLG